MKNHFGTIRKRYSLLTRALPATTNGQLARGTSASRTRCAAMLGPVCVCVGVSDAGGGRQSADGRRRR